MNRVKLFLVKNLSFWLISNFIDRRLKILASSFDRSYYLDHYKYAMDGFKDPVAHYHFCGWKVGYNPTEKFCTVYYLNKNIDVAGSGQNPFLHFIRYGKNEGRKSSAVNKDSSKNSYEYFSIRNALKKDYITIKDHIDKEYYLSHNKDINGSSIDPVFHFLSTGYIEGRNPTEYFDSVYYHWNNFDIIPKYQNPFAHYIETGKKLGLKPSGDIESGSHLDFEHSFSLYADHNAVPSVRTKLQKDYSLSVPLKFEYKTKPQNVIAVIAHVYYTDVLELMLQYLANIPYKYTLFISTDSEQKKQEIDAILREKLFLDFEIRVFENRGRDIAPFIVGFDDVLRSHEIFLHIHSKKSVHGGDPLSQWGVYLFKNLLGSQDSVKSIIYLLSNPNIGVIFPQHYYPIRPCLNWGYDYDMVARLLERCGFKLNSNKLLEFPSGSMFWGKSDAILPLLDLKLKFEDFQEEKGQIDGTLAHAIERVLLYICELANYRWVKVLDKTVEYIEPKCVLKSNNSAECSNNIDFVYRSVLIKQVGNITQKENKLQLASYVHAPSDCVRPRINLLIPSINPVHTFGGVATALKIFNELDELYYNTHDFRIIVTSAYVTIDARDNFQKYELNTPSVLDNEIRYEVVTNCKRHKNPLSIRKNDVFIATAWWTAIRGFEAIDTQKLLFKSSQKLIYLIQDFEPGFYGWSSEWALAENTLRRGEDTVAIINSSQLVGFLGEEYNFYKSYYFDYSKNPKIKFNTLEKREKILVFYGRPGTARNLFEIIIDGMSLWQKSNPMLARDWKIISVGEPYDPDDLPMVQNLSVLGKLTLEEYSKLLNTASIGISLMLSPHPSYPPLEMAQAGLITITNACFGKNLAALSENMLSLDLVSEDTIADAISAAIARANNSELKSKPLSLMPIDSKSARIYDPALLLKDVGLSLP